jgi:phenylalanyl-tRNA synthetase alpha subunit
MKESIENILKAIQALPTNSQQYVIKQLKNINTRMAHLEIKIEEKRLVIAGKKKNTYTDSLEKAIDILRLFGFNEDSFEGINPDFINWMLLNTLPNTKYNPKLQNKYLIDSFQQAWYLTRTTNEEPTYKEVRDTLLTFDETIKEYQKEANKSLTELIKEIDG